MPNLDCLASDCKRNAMGVCTDSSVLACYTRTRLEPISSNPPKITETSIVFRPSWEDAQSAGVHKLVCSCGTDLTKGYDKEDFTVTHEEVIECPDCHTKHQFIWVGMTVKELK